MDQLLTGRTIEREDAVRFLVELFVPRSAARQAALQAEALRVASSGLGEEGTTVRYLDTVFVPEDETCFHLIEAADLTAVAEIAARAGLTDVRIRDALQFDSRRQPPRRKDRA